MNGVWNIYMCRLVPLGAVALVSLASLAGCGVYTPVKNPLVSDAPNADGLSSDQGNFEIRLADHIQCEIAQGLTESSKFKLPWLHNWGATITQTTTVEDQSGVSPGISTIQPIGSAAIPFAQYASQSVGVTGSANALRTETIQYTMRNADIEKYEPAKTCFNYDGKPFIEGDLKIREFIFDHAALAYAGPARLSGNSDTSPPFNAFTEEITFVAALGGSVTPTWKLARFTANTSSNLLIAQRTHTSDVVITLGPLQSSGPSLAKPNRHPADIPIQLTDAAMSQHFSRVQASAIAVAVTGQTH